MRTVVISGSSRNDGDTFKLVSTLVEKSNYDVIDLNDYKFSYFDYNHANKNDDYLSLMHLLLTQYDTLIFVTPVYWYSMSGILKVFFDRLSDLLTIEKELGRRLKGKNMAVVSCSNGNNLGDSFWLPFSETAKYLKMEYLGNLHTIAGDSNLKEVSDFIALLKE